MFPFAILHDIIVADKRFFGVEAQGTGGSAQHVFAVEGEDGDVSCQAWFQFQVRVVGGDDYFVGHNRAGAGVRRAA